MSARYSRCLEMTWYQMDVRQLSFGDASFDVILEKATLDAIMVEEKTPWEMSPETTCFIHQALTEVFLQIFQSYRKIWCFKNWDAQMHLACFKAGVLKLFPREGQKENLSEGHGPNAVI